MADTRDNNKPAVKKFGRPGDQKPNKDGWRKRETESNGNKPGKDSWKKKNTESYGNKPVRDNWKRKNESQAASENEKSRKTLETRRQEYRDSKKHFQTKPDPRFSATTDSKPFDHSVENDFRDQKANALCPIYRKCGSCAYLSMSYEEQLKIKQKQADTLLKKFGPVRPIIGMKNPYNYRNKVHAVFDRDKKGNIICGTYEARSHQVLSVENCLLEDRKSQEIIRSIRDLCKSFKIKTYDEDTGYGLLRHVLVRRGFKSGEIMVILVLGSPILPSKNNFVKALRKLYPEITSVVININDKQTSMVLGDRDIPLYGPMFIKDTLCDTKFRISPKSFYQVNPVQTEILYKLAMDYAGLTGREKVLDAYCGIGTISLVAARRAKEVIGVELNPDAVRDARINAKENEIKNAAFFQGDAGEFLVGLAERGEHLDTVFMDPPRSGSSPEFLNSVIKCGPENIVYVSCNPETLARDLDTLVKKGYKVRRIQPVDMFPWTEHVETVVLMSKQND